MPEPRGFLLIDKPSGCSSFDVVRGLRKLTRIRRIGHTGTLDPFATGLLICALGSATRLCGYLEAEDKTYSATLRLGSQTNTGDTEGDFVRQDGPIPDKLDEAFLHERVLGLKELSPPQHSALKVNGRPAYDYARKGEKLDLAPRPVRISKFGVLNYDPPDLTYVCRVSKGTYIRSLSEYIAGCIGTVGHTVALRREAIGAVDLSEAWQLDELTPENYQAAFHPPRNLFTGFEFYQPRDAELAALRNGQGIGSEGKDTDRILLLDGNDTLLGVAKRSSGFVQPVINLR